MQRFRRHIKFVYISSMKKYIVSIAISYLASVAVGNAITVNLFATSAIGQYVAASESILDSGSLVRYGTLDVDAFNSLSESDKQSFSAVDSLFIELGTAAIGANGDLVSTNNTYTLPSGGIGFSEQLYVWVFNSSNTSSSSEWGIFTNLNTPVWTTGGTNASTANLSTTSSYGSMSAIYGTINTGGSVNTYSLAPVPEPGVYAGLFGVCALGYLQWRRRRRVA